MRGQRELQLGSDLLGRSPALTQLTHSGIRLYFSFSKQPPQQPTHKKIIIKKGREKKEKNCTALALLKSK